MADEEEGTEEEVAEEAGEPKKLPVVLILAVLEALLLAGALGYYFTVVKPNQLEAHSDLSKDIAVTSEHDIEHDEFVEGEMLEGERPMGAIFPLDTFVVNLQSEGFLKCKIQVEFVEREIPRRFKSRQVLLRDAIVALLSSKQRKTLLTSKGKDSLREELAELIDSVSKGEVVEKIFFTEFIVR